jgi:hypothetical protein
MKNNIYIVLIIVFTACNSINQRPDSVVIGEIENMYVIEFNKTFKGVWVGEGDVNERSHSFDLDSDGSFDFILTSFTDTIYNTTSNSNQIIFACFLTLNPNRSSGIQYGSEQLLLEPIENDTLITNQNGSSLYWVYNYNCIVEGLTYPQEAKYSYVKRLNYNGLIKRLSNDWINNKSYRNLIYHSNYNEYSIQTYHNYDFTCLNPQKKHRFLYSNTSEWRCYI